MHAEPLLGEIFTQSTFQGTRSRPCPAGVGGVLSAATDAAHTPFDRIVPAFAVSYLVTTQIMEESI